MLTIDFEFVQKFLDTPIHPLKVSFRSFQKALKQAFDELNASHERLEEAHEKLVKAHKKLEKAHSSLLNEQNEKEHIVTCNKGLTCHIIDESFYKTIVVAPANPSCS